MNLFYVTCDLHCSPPAFDQCSPRKYRSMNTYFVNFCGISFAGRFLRIHAYRLAKVVLISSGCPAFGRKRREMRRHPRTMRPPSPGGGPGGKRHLYVCHLARCVCPYRHALQARPDSYLPTIRFNTGDDHSKPAISPETSLCRVRACPVVLTRSLHSLAYLLCASAARMRLQLAAGLSATTAFIHHRVVDG